MITFQSEVKPFVNHDSHVQQLLLKCRERRGRWFRQAGKRIVLYALVPFLWGDSCHQVWFLGWWRTLETYSVIGIFALFVYTNRLVGTPASIQIPRATCPVPKFQLTLFGIPAMLVSALIQIYNVSVSFSLFFTLCFFFTGRREGGGCHLSTACERHFI